MSANLLLPLFFLFSCSHFVAHRTIKARVEAKKGLLRERHIQAGSYQLMAFYRLGDPELPLYVFIEGDGLAWQSRYKVSPDPTPTEPILLSLAARSPYSNVLYLGRPCQYLLSENPNCQERDWTDWRFSQKIVDSLKEAITQIKAPGQKVHYIGYSGGGNLAGILAAEDISALSFITFAGNIDPVGVNEYHQVTPFPHVKKLTRTLWELEILKRLKDIPQRHYIGDGEQIIPISLFKNFEKKLDSRSEFTIKVLKGVDHYSGWERFSWR